MAECFSVVETWSARSLALHVNDVEPMVEQLVDGRACVGAASLVELVEQPRDDHRGRKVGVTSRVVRRDGLPQEQLLARKLGDTGVHLHPC